MPGSFQSTSRWYETWPMASMKSASGSYQSRRAGRRFIKILATGRSCRKEYLRKPSSIPTRSFEWQSKRPHAGDPTSRRTPMAQRESMPLSPAHH